MRARTRGEIAIVGLMVLGALWVVGCRTTPAPAPSSIASTDRQPFADERNLIHEVRIDQDDINAGNVAFEDLFYAGKHIFSNRFTSEDHYGEGPDGPRRSRYSIADRENYPFLRFNGLDSQSCLECHLAVGFAAQENYPSGSSRARFGKQLGFTAGGAGFASSAFGFINFDGQSTTADDDGCQISGGPTTRGFVRSPPHAFGAGYVQTLAEEMSWDLMDQVQAAMQERTGQPVPLSSKGISFGSVTVAPDGTVTKNLEGVSDDLVVRPFQWKGIASNLRSFIRDAMNFHFSIQPREFLVLHPQSDDKDGELNEILEGEISAVATFLAFMRPPTESAAGLDAQEVKRGRMVFEQVGCTTCHTPTLVIDRSVATIRDPRKDQAMMDAVRGQAPSLAAAATASVEEPQGNASIFITVPSGVSPTLEKYAASRSGAEGGATPEFGPQARSSSAMLDRLQGFSRDLGLDDGPPETLPRLASQGQRTTVPLFSDLKRHKMGSHLAEPCPQRTDGGQVIPGDEFLTRPLWGVADTGPWLHDGRALTLTEAILLHDGPGSEASDSVAEFSSLSDADRRAVRAFLSSLRLPTVP